MATDPASRFSLLVVDDEPDLRTLYELTLLREGYHIDTAGTLEDALERLEARGYNLIITDMRLPDGSGLDLLRRLEQDARTERAIVITAYGSAENAVEALKSGAYDYLAKPVDLKQFRMVVASALGRGPATVSAPLPTNAWARTTRAPAEAPPEPVVERRAEPRPVAKDARPSSQPAQAVAPALRRMLGESEAMAQVRALVVKVARSMAPVLVHGESGTGKELVARAIHDVSPRGAQTFLAVNCSAIPEHLLESEFFGYKKGAFTGATEDRAGFFQTADGGTLFLDEIGDLPLPMQSKLLRAVQERAVRQVGGVVEHAVNVRLLSATHKDLASEVQAGRFRQDLYYRLNVIGIRVPPLRERLQDLPAITTGVLERIARDAGVWPPPSLTPAAMARLASYPFPGNVRELENLLHRAVALSGDDSIDAADLGLPDDAGDEPELEASAADDAARPGASRTAGGGRPAALPADLAAHLDEVEREILLRALQQHRYNRTAAGASMGLSLRQMRYRMARLKIGGEGEATDEVHAASRD